MAIKFIEPKDDFLGEIKNYVMDLAKDQFSLSKIHIFLPNRRYAKYLTQYFLDEATLLPDITTFDDFDEMLLYDLPEYFQNSLSVISKQEAVLKLADIIFQNRSEFKNIKNYKYSLILAQEFYTLIEEMNAEFVSLDSFKDLSLDTSAAYWQDLQRFICTVLTQWQEFLHAQALETRSQKRNRLIWQLQEAIKKSDKQFVIAGNEASIQIVRKLISQSMNLTNCHILFYAADEVAIGQDLDEYHAQYYYQLLCHTREGGYPSSDGSMDSRLRGNDSEVATIFTPKNHNVTPQEITNLEIIKADNIFEESEIISLIIRQNLGQNKTVCLVTENKDIARTVKITLEKWQISCDDALGENIFSTAQFSFLIKYLEFMKNKFSCPEFLELIKSPFWQLGKEESNQQFLIRKIEYRLRKSLIYFENITDIISYFHAEQDIVKFLKTNQEFLENTKLNFSSLEKFIASILDAINKFSGNKIFTLKNGEDFKKFLEDVGKEKQSIDSQEIIAILEMIATQTALHQKYDTSNMVKILRPSEARLLKFDAVIIADLNENSWPQAVNENSIISKNMRAQIGLPKKEAKIGLAMLDAYPHFYRDKLYLTRSIVKNGSPTIKSRILWRIEAFVTQESFAAMDKSEYWKGLVSYLYNRNEKTTLSNYVPAIDSEFFPKEFSVTDMGMLFKNPYGFYNKKILNLKKLEPVKQELDMRDFGNFIHKTLELVVKNYSANDDLKTKFAAESLKALELLHLKLDARIEVIWLEKLMQIYEIMHEELIIILQDETSQIFLEIQGSADIEAGSHIYKLTAKADRIDVNENTLELIDYKTGKIPSKKQILAGGELQLLAESFILSVKGYQINSQNPIRITYLQLKNEINNNRTTLEVTLELLDNFQQNLKSLLQHFQSPTAQYLYQPNPKNKVSYNDYEHLAREEEVERGG